VEGEGQEYADPREAAEAAIAICRAWRKAGEKHVKVAHGTTGGYTLPFESVTFTDLRAWADQIWEKLEKCPVCGGPLPDKRKCFRLWDTGDDTLFCSESCAEKESDYQAAENAKLNEICDNG